MPTCPGWVARDLVDHVGEVYAHKVAVLRLARRPEEGEWPWAPDDDGVFSWYDERLAELVGELDARDPAATAWTFVDADQSVGFWWLSRIRKMEGAARFLPAVLLTHPHPATRGRDGQQTIGQQHEQQQERHGR